MINSGLIAISVPPELVSSIQTLDGDIEAITQLLSKSPTGLYDFDFTMELNRDVEVVHQELQLLIKLGIIKKKKTRWFSYRYFLKQGICADAIGFVFQFKSRGRYWRPML